jgi:hypothetical protein
MKPPKSAIALTLVFALIIVLALSMLALDPRP